MSADEDGSPQPKAGGVKAMLAALNKKNADSHVVLPDGSVPKRSWKPPPKKDAPPDAPALDSTPQKPALRPTPGNSRGASNSGTEKSSPAMKTGAPPSSGDLSQDELAKVRAEVAARRNAGGAPPGPAIKHHSRFIT